MVSGSISLPLPGFFSPFPHGTCPLSVATEYLALDRGRPRFRQSFTCSAVLRCRLRVKFISCTRLSLSLTSLPRLFHYKLELLLYISGPTTPLAWFGLFRFRSPLLSESLLISIPELLRWFSSLSMTLYDYFIHQYSAGITSSGLPHSVIYGS